MLMNVGAGIAPPFLTSELDEGELSASRPYRFILWETALSSYWIVSWLDLRAGLDVLVKRRNFRSYQKQNHNSSVVQPTD
jgi:hypothetical protein